MKKTIRLTENDFHRIISESVRKILRESEEDLTRFGLRLVDFDNPNSYLSVSGIKAVKRGRGTYQWFIEFGDKTYCSQHNFNEEDYAESNCTKHLREISDALGIDITKINAYVDGIWSNQDGEIESDTRLVWEDGMWMD